MVMEVGKVLQIVKRFITNPKIRFSYLTEIGITHLIQDESFIKKEYELAFGKKLDLENPVTYNEKLQWLKLYNRKPEYTMMVDKFEAKKYVATIIGEEYIIPTLGVWNRFKDIDFDSLPDQFVLKCTHDSGGIVICEDKSTFDKSTAERKINRCLKKNYYYEHREWPYKNVKPRIIAEKYMEDSKTNELRDYKIFTFGGQAKMLYIATDRKNNLEETKFDFFDMDFNHLDIINGHPNSSVLLDKPICLEKMKILAEKIAYNIPHARIDFYEVDGNIYWGEITFSHMGGLVPFEPELWDEILGSWITLPINTNQ